MHDLRSSIRFSQPPAETPVWEKPTTPKAGSGGGLAKIPIRRTEARVTDHRREDRHLDLVQECAITFRGRKQTVGVVNVSSRGAMLEAELDASIGEALDIEFSDQAKTRCLVRWMREGRIGVEFVDETIFWDAPANDPVFRETRGKRPRPKGGPRKVVEREARKPIERTGFLYWGGVSIPVRLRNISTGGAQVEGEGELAAGTQVELDLGDAGCRVAEIRWAEDGQIGLRFARPFALGALIPAEAADPDAPYLETDMLLGSPWAARFQRLTAEQLKRKGGD